MKCVRDEWHERVFKKSNVIAYFYVVVTTHECHQGTTRHEQGT